MRTRNLVIRILGVLAVATAMLLATTATAQARGGAELVVAKGKIKAKGGSLKGSFAIRNVGSAKSKGTTAALRVQVPGKDPIAGRYAVRALAPGGTAKAKVDVPVPSGLPGGKASIVLCVDGGCAKVGKVKGGGGGGGSGSSKPDSPIDYPTAEPFEISSSASKYWVFVPESYDASHNTPTTLFVWSHGCGGDSGGDIYTISPGGDQSWISVSVGGKDGACWDTVADQDKILKAISSMKTHFNINPRTVVLGGYSSGGDLSYRTAFEHSRQIAGVLAENTSPFRDTGLSQQESIAAASFKFNVVHLAHTQDDTYGIDGVRAETNALKAAGFPVQFIERPGTHYDGNTDPEVAELLLPHLNDGWTAPG